VRIGLDLDLGGEPVSGRLVAASGDVHPFTGYAGLIAALEQLRRSAAMAAEHDGASRPDARPASSRRARPAG
jgi:hypothetical protein